MSSPPPQPPGQDPPGTPPPPGYYAEGSPPPDYYSDSPQTTGLIPRARREPADDYLYLSIVSCIFLNLILGIIAIVFSYKTRMANGRRDYKAAESHSQSTLIFIVAAAILFLFTLILFLVFGWKFR